MTTRQPVEEFFGRFREKAVARASELKEQGIAAEFFEHKNVRGEPFNYSVFYTTTVEDR